MLAESRLKSSEFVSATLSLSVSRVPTHCVRAEFSAELFGSGWWGDPFQPEGRSAGCNTIFLSCDSEAGALLLLPDDTGLPLDVEGPLDDDELPQAASTATTQPAAPTPKRRLARCPCGADDEIVMAILSRAPSGAHDAHSTAGRYGRHHTSTELNILSNKATNARER